MSIFTGRRKQMDLLAKHGSPAPVQPEAPVEAHADLVRAVAALDEAEWQALADASRQESLIPLAHLVIEGLAPNIYALEKKLGDEVVTDDIGRRCISRGTARRLFDDDRARRERESQRRRAAEQQGLPIRERVQAIQARGSTGLNIEPPSWRR